MQQIERVTADGWTEVAFDGIEARSFFVKNFSAADAYISLDQNVTDTSHCFRIPGGMAEEVYETQGSNKHLSSIWVNGSGEIEVEALDWRTPI